MAQQQHRFVRHNHDNGLYVAIITHHPGCLRLVGEDGGNEAEGFRKNMAKHQKLIHSECWQGNARQVACDTLHSNTWHRKIIIGGGFRFTAEAINAM